MMITRFKTIAAYVAILVVVVASLGAINLQLIPNTLPALTPDNTSVDNGPAIQAYMNSATRIPKGRYYFSTTVNAQKEGWGLLGTGLGATARGDSAWDVYNATVLIWNGANTRDTNVFVLGFGAGRVQDIMIQGQQLVNYGAPTGILPSPNVPGLMTLMQITNNVQSQAVGNIVFQRVHLCSALFGWHAEDGNHCDHITIEDCVSSRIGTVICCEENQAVEWQIRNLLCKSDGDCVMWWKQGGRMNCESIVPLGNWNALLRLGCGGTITGVTAGTPIVYTCPDHGLWNGAYPVSVTGVAGVTGANVSSKVAVVIDADHFSLSGVDGTGTYTSGGSFRVHYNAKNAGFYRIANIQMDNTTYYDYCVEERSDYSTGTNVVDITGYGAEEVGFPTATVLNLHEGTTPASRINVNIKRNQFPDIVYPVP